MKKLIKLKCCPFCGGWSEINHVRPAYERMYEVRCSDCGCATDACDEEWRAVEMWNRRVTERIKKEDIQ